MTRGHLLQRARIRDHRGHHPWRTIALLPSWRVEFVSPALLVDAAAKYGLDHDELGATLHDQQRILIRDDLDCAGRRSVLAHETGHALRGPVGCRRRQAEEALVERQAARLLVPSVRRIGHALAWHHADHDRAAHDLWVDPQLLHTRLSTLAPAERAWLNDQLGEILV